MQAQCTASFIDVPPSDFSRFSRMDDFSEAITDEFEHKLNLRDSSGSNGEDKEEEEEEEVVLQQSTGECNSCQREDEDEVEDDDEDGFEFSFVCGDGTNSPISADDIFQNGKIKPIFPLFGTVEQILDLPKLPPSSKEDTEEEGVAYCLWSRNVPPPAEACRKSNSTGFSKFRRFRELLLLQRSQSDGKDAFVFFTEKRGGEINGKETKTVSSSSSSSQAKKKICNLTSAECKAANSSSNCHLCASPKPMPYGERTSKTASSATSFGVRTKTTPSSATSSGVRTKTTPSSATSSGVRTKTTPSSFAPYGGSSSNTNNGGKQKRRSYLPYRQDLVGFFTSASTITRNVHPY